MKMSKKFNKNLNSLSFNNINDNNNLIIINFNNNKKILL